MWLRCIELKMNNKWRGLGMTNISGEVWKNRLRLFRHDERWYNEEIVKRIGEIRVEGN